MRGLAWVRLLQLSSQALPIGGFSHSHGLESAIGDGVVRDEASLRTWIEDVYEYCMKDFEIPWLLSMAASWTAEDSARAAEENREFLASRESSELRAATVQMGFSLRALLAVLPDVPAETMQSLVSMQEPSLPCVWSAAAAAWQIEPPELAAGYLWSWAENQVLAAIKTLPLGQSAGQRVLFAFGARIAQLSFASAPSEEVVVMHAPRSNFAPGLAILSSRHESQYSRLFRS